MTSAKTLRSPKPSRQVGIKDLAASLGISIGTVDRALHNRLGVNPVTRDRVLKTAEKLGYRPNVAARFLKLNRTLRIAVLLPAEIATFFQPLREGIRAGALVWPDTGLEMRFEEYTRFGSGDVALLRTLIGKHYDGIVCAPSDAGAATPVINQLEREGTAVVCVATDAVRSERLASIAIDGYVSGSLAAELLSYALPPSATVGVFTGDLRAFDHSEKLRGYAASLALLAPHLSLLPVVESHDDPDQAYSLARKMLAQHTTMQGLYVSTANSLTVLRAIREAGRLNSVRTVVTDLSPELVSEMENGYVMAALYQRPFTQGRIAIQSLLRYLRENAQPARITKLAPHVVMRGNLSVFSRYVEDPRSIPG